MDADKTPLNIYVLWHPDFEEGTKYAQDIYRNFTRDINDPLTRGIGIPVFFLSQEIMDDIGPNINYTSANNTAILILIESNMVLDKKWHDIIDIVITQSELTPDCMIYPIAVEKCAFSISDKIQNTNFIRLYDIKESEKKEEVLVYKISHELCRLLYKLKRTSEVSSDMSSFAPVNLFISHAKEDGLEIAKSLNEYILSNTSLKTFFDANDIATGYEFPQEIESNINNSVLLIIHTDKYASREWCRREILLAKKYNRPIIEVNVLVNGEDRSFPYMANIRTVRVESPLDKEVIIGQVLMETLRFKYQELYINYLSHKFGIEIDRDNILSYPPELLSLLFLKECDNKIVVYPDPPLSDEEIKILQMSKKNTTFITPSLLPCISDGFKDINKGMDEVIIGISISESEDIAKFGFNQLHLQDAMIEIARYLLACNVILAYGGDINYNHKFNFVNILIDLVRSHNKEHKKLPQRIKNYVSYPIYTTFTKELKADLYNIAEFIEIPPIDENATSFDNDPLYQQYIFARNLSNMRKIMNSQTNGRIFLGGKTKKYKGKIPGVVEEAYIALSNNKPMYLCGAFGGSTRVIIQCIKGEEPLELTEQYQFAESDYEKFYDYYNKQASKEGNELIDYPKLTEFFSSKGINGLNNGLTDEENELLFKTTNIMEIITLILKGLINITNV